MAGCEQQGVEISEVSQSERDVQGAQKNICRATRTITAGVIKNKGLTMRRCLQHIKEAM